tara:strand:+ start:182 stop:757 length:576 start_codon:yes stop_codon:yes gene_type:complete
MNISISGKQTKVGKSLTVYARENIISTLTKYFDKFISANIIFSKARFSFICEISLHIDSNLYVQSSAESNDAYGAFNVANEKIKKRVRRYHRKIVDHRKKRKVSDARRGLVASQYLIKNPENNKKNEVDIDNPIIIAEDKIKIQTLSVSEALMIMNLNEQNAILFRNSKSKKLNFLSKKNDGNISWIEPKI